MPLLLTRQPDTFGVLGLALNALRRAPNGHREETRADPRAPARRARPLARAARGGGRGRAAHVLRAPPFRLLHLADIITVTAQCLSSRVNGGAHDLDAPVGRTLAETLRDDLGLTGTKIACDEGHCGACTVQLDGVPVLSCITLVHTVGAREVTTIEGLRDHPLVDAFVRADALQCGFCTPGQIVSAAALVAANPEPDARRDPPRDGRQPLPLRHLSANRGGDPRRGETDPHREGGRGALRGGLDRRRGGRARAVARRAARGRRPRRPRVRTAASARAARRATPPTSSCPGCCMPRSCAAARARARRHARSRAARSRSRAFATALGPDECDDLTGARLRRRSGRGGGGRHASAQARAGAGARSKSNGSRSSVPRCRGGARGRLAHRRADSYERGDVERGSRARGRRRGGGLPHPGRPAQLARDARVGLRMARRRARRLRLDAVDLGRPPRGRAARSACRSDSVRVVCEFMGGGFGSKTSADDTRSRRAARAADRPTGEMRAVPPRGEPRRGQSQRDRQRLRVGARADGTLTALGCRLRPPHRLSTAGSPRPPARPDALRLRARPHGRPRREGEPAADEGVPRAGLRRGDVRARVRCSTSSRPSSESTRSSCAGRTTRRPTRATARPSPTNRSSATTSRSRTGTGGSRCAPAPTSAGSAGSGWRARSGTGRRPALVRVGARRL